MVDASCARVLAFESLLRTERVDGTARGEIKPLYAEQPSENHLFPWLNVYLTSNTTTGTTAVSIDLDLPQDAGRIRLEIHDVSGKLMSRPMDARLADGLHRVVWNGVDLSERSAASGTYYDRIVSKLGEERGRLVLLR